MAKTPEGPEARQWVPWILVPAGFNSATPVNKSISSTIVRPKRVGERGIYERLSPGASSLSRPEIWT